MQKIALIGGGPAAVSFCIQLFEQLKNKSIDTSIEITVFEKNAHIGYGVPYSQKHNSLILNLSKEIMEPVYGWKGHFSRWLSTVPGSPQSEFPPRHYFGQYLEHVAKDIQKQAGAIGVKINFLVNNEVWDIQETHAKKFEIQSKSGTYTADYVILCTGHMPPSAYRKLIGKEGYCHDAGDPHAYMELPKNENVGIIGTRLTAIDTARRLENENHQGRILMASRSGLLPTVLAKDIPSYPLKYLTLSTLTHMTKSGLVPLPLSNLLALFWKEMSDAQGYHCDFNSIQKSYKDISPLDWINREIKQAEAGPKPWQQVLFALYPAMPTIWSMLSLSDQTLFMEKYYSLFLTYLAAFPLENAYKIRDLLKSGQLEVLGGLETIKHENNAFKMILANDRPISLKYVLNATGQAYDPSAIPLYHNMIKGGLLQPHPLGGIYVHPQTLEVLYNSVKEPCRKLFAIGELTRGVCLATTDMSRVAAQCDKVSATVIHKISALKFSQHHTLWGRRSVAQEENRFPIPKPEMKFFKPLSVPAPRGAKPLAEIKFNFNIKLI